MRTFSNSQYVMYSNCCRYFDHLVTVSLPVLIVCPDIESMLEKNLMENKHNYIINISLAEKNLQHTKYILVFFFSLCLTYDFL